MAPIRAACYCRISSDPDDKREGVQRQREDTTALCEVKGWAAAGFYIDNNRSASNGHDRPEWHRLLADIEAGKIDAIAAWNQDRSWRVMSELEELRKFFTALGRKIVFATTSQGEIDLYSPDGIFQLQVKTAASEFEVAMMKVRMRRAAKQKADNGVPHWSRAFGYLGDTHQLDPVTAPLVAQGYASVLAGASLTDVATLWNDAGAYTLTGKKWTAALVSMFLQAPRNAGLRSHSTGGATTIIGAGTWPPLVDEALWRAARNALDGRGGRRGRRTVRKHPLTGVLGCGKCGGYLSGMKTSGGVLIYGCKDCHGVSIRAEHVTPLVHQLVAGRLAMPDAVDLLKAEVHDQAEAEVVRVELNRLYGEVENIGVERADGLLTGPQAKAATDRLTEKIAVLERRQQDAERLRVFADLPLGTPQVAAAVEALSPDRFRAVIDVLATITVAPTGKGGGVFNPERVQVNWR